MILMVTQEGHELYLPDREKYDELTVFGKCGHGLDLLDSCFHCIFEDNLSRVPCPDCGCRGEHYCLADVDTHDTDPLEAPILCDWCCRETDSLTEVNDSDPSVGYSSTLLVCRDCREKKRCE